MEGTTHGQGRRRLLEFFGLDTAQKVGEVLLWAGPYLCVLAAALLGLSFLVQWLFPLPLWVHGAAIGPALVYFFFFLAWLRRAAEAPAEDDPDGGEGDSAPPRKGE